MITKHKEQYWYNAEISLRKDVELFPFQDGSQVIVRKYNSVFGVCWSPKDPLVSTHVSCSTIFPLTFVRSPYQSFPGMCGCIHLNIYRNMLVEGKPNSIYWLVNTCDALKDHLYNSKVWILTFTWTDSHLFQSEI